MASITNFKADSTGIYASITDTSEPTSCTVLINDGTSVVLNFIDESPSGVFNYSLAGNYLDGIYTLNVVDSGSLTLSSFIANTVVGNECLLKKVINEEFDCSLFQQLKAVIDLTLKQEDEEIVREVYSSVLAKCTACVDIQESQLSGISVWIINDDFIVQ